MQIGKPYESPLLKMIAAIWVFYRYTYCKGKKRPINVQKLIQVWQGYTVY